MVHIETQKVKVLRAKQKNAKPNPLDLKPLNPRGGLKVGNGLGRYAREGVHGIGEGLNLAVQAQFRV